MSRPYAKTPSPHPPITQTMLRDVQTYIADHGTVSVADLSLHFHTSIDTLQPMLNKLSRKARIRQLPTPEKCSGCTSCNHHDLVCYEWVGTHHHIQISSAPKIDSPTFRITS